MAIRNNRKRRLKVNKTYTFSCSFIRYGSYYNEFHKRRVKTMLLMSIRDMQSGISVGSHLWITLLEDRFKTSKDLEKVLESLEEGDELIISATLVSYNKFKPETRSSNPNKMTLDNISVLSIRKQSTNLEQGKLYACHA